MLCGDVCVDWGHDVGGEDVAGEWDGLGVGVGERSWLTALQIKADGEVADVMELNFYNAVLTGMSCDGKAFTYVNQLASSATDLSRRSEWFTCACCPPNVARLLGYLGGYLWTSSVDESQKVSVNVHMYGSATLTVPVGDSAVTVKQESEWPYDGKIGFEVKAPDGIEVDVKLRIPSWASEWQVR